MTIDIGKELARLIEFAIYAWVVIRVAYLLGGGRWK